MAVTVLKGPILQKSTFAKTDGVSSATLVWGLQIAIPTTNIDALAYVVQSAFSEVLPIEGTALPGLPLVTCRSTSCESTDINGVYTFTAQYSDKAVDNSQETPTAAFRTNPLDDPPIVVPTAAMKQRGIYKDRDGNALLNSAGDPVIESIDDNTISFTIKCNVAVNMPATVLNFRNTCNDAAIVVGGLTVSANAARFILPSNFLSEPKTRNDVSYREFTFEILIDETDKHYEVPMDAGWRERIELLDEGDVSFDPPQYEKRKILEADGSEPPEPVPLSGGLKIVDPAPEDVEYLELKIYPEADYTTLPGITAAPPEPP